MCNLFWLLLMGYILLSPGILFPQIVEQKNSGVINWERRTIIARGVGIPNKSLDQAAWSISAERAAKLDALAELLAIAKGITIDRSETVGDCVLADQGVEGRVKGVIRNFSVVDTRYNPDGSVEVDVEIPIDGAFSDIFIPDIKPQIPAEDKPQIEDKPQMPDTQKQLDMQEEAEPKPTESEMVAENLTFTGIVLDAKGLNIRPSMMPRILNESGVEVYGSEFVLREFAVEQGIAGYHKNLEKAQGDFRVKDNPLMIRGISSSGPRNTDIVISNVDAEKLHSLDSSLKFMECCKVIIVLD